MALSDNQSWLKPKIITTGGGNASNATFTGNVGLGDDNADDISVIGKITTNLIPDQDNIFNVGDPLERWANLYATNGVFSTLSTDGGVTFGDNAADNIIVNGSLDVNEPSTFGGNVTIETGSQIICVDLTPTRVLFVGASNEITDNAGLTFDPNGNFVVGLNTIEISSGNTSIAGTLTAGESVFSSATVSDLTSGRIVLAGTNGALEDNVNLTFDGSELSVTGSVATTSLSVGGGVGDTGLSVDTNGNLSTDGSITGASVSTSGVITTTDTTAASSGAGAIVSTGGISTSSNLYVGTSIESGGDITSSGAGTFATGSFGGGYDSNNLTEGLSIDADGNLSTNGDILSNTLTTTGNVSVGGDLSITGNLSPSSITLSGITATHIVYGDANQNLVGNAGLTWTDASSTLSATNLSVGTEATLASAIVSDLTATRLIIAGANSELEDSDQLTFDGTTFDVGGGSGGTGLSITASNGNLTTDGSINGDSLTTTNGVTVGTDLGVGGNTNLTGTLDVTGDTSVSTFDSSGATSLATGGGDVNIATTGATTTIKGLLNVDEAVTLDSTLGVTGDATFTGAGSFGSVSVGGGYSDLTDGGLSIDSSGNLSTDGTLSVDGVTNFNDTTGSTNSTTGAVVIDGGVGVAENLNVGGNISATDVSATDGGFSGTLTTQNLTVNGTFSPTNVSVGSLTQSHIVYGGASGALVGDASFTFDTLTGMTINNDISTKNLAISQGVTEEFSELSSQSGTVTHDCDNGHIFYHNGLNGNITINLINFSLAAGQATTITLVVAQGATPQTVSAIQSSGVSLGTILWQGGVAPTGTASATDVFCFNIMRRAASYVILGQMIEDFS